ncbi:hypothetical protein ARMSODRAFT_31802 [Armillaria solidipes]|uniref:Uncharacterized protein n=1 Tax=Armillaria solidipes TaxID=1076256 RepID=A0A2H3CA92_9AGAR|nr:hypothetical protein ARMSODRAFT_31802 [Armillaria solidipes]
MSMLSSEALSSRDSGSTTLNSANSFSTPNSTSTVPFVPFPVCSTSHFATISLPTSSNHNSFYAHLFPPNTSIIRAPGQRSPIFLSFAPRNTSIRLVTDDCKDRRHRRHIPQVFLFSGLSPIPQTRLPLIVFVVALWSTSNETSLTTLEKE